MGTFKASSLAVLIKLLGCACLHNDRRSQSAKINGGFKATAAGDKFAIVRLVEVSCGSSIIDGLSCLRFYSK